MNFFRWPKLNSVFKKKSIFLVNVILIQIINGQFLKKMQDLVVLVEAKKWVVKSPGEGNFVQIRG